MHRVIAEPIQQWGSPRSVRPLHTVVRCWNNAGERDETLSCHQGSYSPAVRCVLFLYGVADDDFPEGGGRAALRQLLPKPRRITSGARARPPGIRR